MKQQRNITANLRYLILNKFKISHWYLVFGIWSMVVRRAQCAAVPAAAKRTFSISSGQGKNTSRRNAKEAVKYDPSSAVIEPSSRRRSKATAMERGNRGNAEK
jgi:hypothetical protein